MSVQTLKITRIHESALSPMPDDSDTAMIEWMELEEGVSPADAVGEFAGRACYQSWDKPNPDTRRNEDYIAHIQQVGHFSVLAHAVVGYYIEGVSRSLTHELVRHRWVSFSQLSQRYVKIEGELPYVVPPLFRGNKQAEVIFRLAARDAVSNYQALLTMKSAHPKDATPKQIRQAARAVLPNMTETKIVVSANLRAWRDMLAQRLPKTADEEIRELAELLLADLKAYAPASFQDLG
jgi:thymidylate synthase (FAD)